MVQERSGVSRRDRPATESALEEAALRLLERDGVLSGLNLAEVAAEAGVNRGLVYQYFGSRQGLLRAALRSDARRRLTEVRESSGLPFRERFGHFFRTMIRHRQAVRLVTLLVQDGDRIRTMPLREGTLATLRRDVGEGNLEALDLEVLHVSLVSLAYGYVLYRERFASELGVPVTQLDGRFIALCDRVLEGLEPR